MCLAYFIWFKPRILMQYWAFFLFVPRLMTICCHFSWISIQKENSQFVFHEFYLYLWIWCQLVSRLWIDFTIASFELHFQKTYTYFHTYLYNCQLVTNYLDTVEYQILDRVLKNENSFFRTPAYYKKIWKRKS